ncbi:Glycosyltransferase involved in cell wall bisynthesis [Candidatus Methylobacter favarea]|uniref:Glycosyltransferase involved in cell wall bisynthesis n=1 Tax=Candidatus Methylobacter favarea TaxID=2707345 RepID=A0A8S0WQF8_9GAMM|nr:glycosyltransferase family 1 protein [Candidatus Methylobacter favarea]CAA9891417.1 Glycosyltransferase involved in cell wall bisynthesis [Candidatus Methylobacter favarea]
MITINGRFFSRRPTGVDRFAFEVISSINDLIEANDPAVRGLSFRIMLPPGVTPEQEFLHIPRETVGRNHGQLWEQWDLPRALPPESLLLSLCNTAPVLSCQQVVVIHDAATVKMPKAFSLAFRLWYRILMPLLGRVSRKVLTVSRFSRQEIVSAFGVPQDKISVIVEGGEHILRIAPDMAAIQSFGLSIRPYVLVVSSMAAHKNFRLVLEAISRLGNPPFDIAIAGGANSRVFGVAGRMDCQRVKWLGYVSDSELRSLYESAMCFVFPSLYEGFGIPPLEAMNCGCPVLASRAASIPEICGDAALYFDAYNANELAALLMRVADDPALRAELAIKGHARAAQFSWASAARQILASLSEVSLTKFVRLGDH